MTAADRYVKIVEWSDEDAAFVGQCPGVIGPCCHGTDEVEVYRQLCTSSRNGWNWPTVLKRPVEGPSAE